MSSMSPRAVRKERGQASLEWLAVVAVVATLLGLGAALAQASYVGRRVTREMARAICIVGAGDCARDREPCVVGSEAGGHALAVDVAIFHLGEDGEALVERRSDGTVAVTVRKGRALGVQASAGLGGEVHAGPVDVELGGDVQAALIARLGQGRTWIVGSEAEAARLLDDLDGAPEPDLVYRDGAWLSSLTAGAGADALVHLDVAHGGLTFDRRAGTRTDRRTGHHTIYVQASWTAEGEVRGGVLGVSAGGAGETYAVELDASGRPVDLRVIASGRFDGSRDLPGAVQPVAGLLAAGSARDRVYEVTAHLDLTDTHNLAAARDLLAAVAQRRAGARPSQALRRRIDEQGSVEARVLEQQASSDEQGARLVLGLPVGGTAQVDRRTQRLVAATSRGLDGQWLPRTDCVPGAAT
jgi:hypothetical protein